MKKSMKIKANDYSFESQLLIDFLTNHKDHLKFMKIKTIYKKTIKSYFNQYLKLLFYFAKIIKMTLALILISYLQVLFLFPGYLYCLYKKKFNLFLIISISIF